MFAQLDTKTVYSFMDSLIDLKSYVKKPRSLDTAHWYYGQDNLYAAFHFIEMARQENLVPVLGLEMNLVLSDEQVRMCFIAQNTAGYQNLLKISTAKMTDHHLFSDVEEFMDGVAVVIPYFEGIENIDIPASFYIGVGPDTPQLNFTHKILPLYTVRYYENAETETLQILHAIRITFLKRSGAGRKNQYLFSEKEMEAVFAERFPESLLNLENLVTSVSYQFDTDLKLPRFNRHKPAVEELKELAQQGLRAKNLVGRNYQERLAVELNVIHKMGFDDYF